MSALPDKKCFGNTYLSYALILSWGYDVNLCLTVGLTKNSANH